MLRSVEEIAVFLCPFLCFERADQVSHSPRGPVLRGLGHRELADGAAVGDGDDAPVAGRRAGNDGSADV